MKTLAQLAEEYESSIALVEDIVRKTRAEMKTAKKERDTDAIKRLSSKLAMLYEEIRDMRIISQQLNHYYDDEYKLQEAV